MELQELNAIVEAFLERIIDQGKTFDAVLKGVKVEPIEKAGTIRCSIYVRQNLQNRMGNLHGGCTGTIVDIIGTAALLTVVGRGGVSMNITTNYLAPMPGYKWATIEANVLRVGKTIAHIEVSIYDGDNLAAKGTHVKFISADEVSLWELARKKRREVAVAGRSKL